MSRRLGAAIGLLAVTGTIALAGSGALDPGSRTDDSPSQTGPAGPGSPAGSGLVDPHSPDLASDPASPAMGTAPSIVGPRSAVTRGSSVTLTVELIEDPEGRASVRLYRAERVIAEARVQGDSAVELRDVPLKRGRNIIAATVISAKGESARSADIVVDRDDAPPELAIGEPAAGSVVNASSVIVRGVSEPAAAVTVTGITRGQVSPVTVPATVAQDGSFEAMVELAVGPNRLTLRAIDGAGNETVASLLLIGGDGRAEARLGLTSSLFHIRRLPQTVSLSVRVVDA
ncbi:MAG: hypothetical protein H0V36_02595, partial [Chloroflexi bacterium]|nr:hypothetical protein [Chloroflexota bacterium]